MSELGALEEAIRGLPMNEPASDQTIARARQLAGGLRGVEVGAGEPAALAGAAARALEGAADRRVLFVFAVPLVVAAVVLLGADKGGPEWERGLAGARYEIETLLPGPVVPDVALASVRDRTKTR